MMIVTRQRQTRDVRGPQPNSVALIARQPSKIPNDKLLNERRQRENALAEAEEVEKQNRWMKIKDDWVAATDKKIEVTNIRRRVNSLKQQNEFSLNCRRERLKELLEQEQEGYILQVANSQETLLERQARPRLKAKQLKDKREAERMSFVQEKLEQQFREDCEDLRTTLSWVQLQEVAAERQDQVKMKKEVEQMQKKEEEAFAKLWYADIEAKAKREEEDAKRQLAANKDTLEFLVKQIAAIEANKQEEKLLLEEERRLMIEEEELRNIEKQQEAEEKRRKQQELREMYSQSVQMKRAQEAREMQEQLAFDLKIMEQLLQESRIEASVQAQRKREIQEEQKRYRTYLMQMKEEERRRDLELEKVCDAEVEKMWEQKIKQWRLERLARQKLMEEVMAARRMQLEEKLQRNLVQREESKRDREELMRTIQENKRIEQEVKDKLRRQHTEYQQDLLGQMAYNCRQIQEEVDEDYRMHVKQREAEEEYRMKVEDLRSRPPIDKIHPSRRKNYFASQSAISSASYMKSGKLN